MAIERRPIETDQDPGYPDVKEYATGRRAFLWLLGSGAVGVAGVCVTKGASWWARPPGGIRPVRPPTPPLIGPVVPLPAGPLPAPLAQPQARLEGEAIAPQPPPAQPQAPIRGDVAAPQMPPALEPAAPKAQPRGRVRAPEPPAQPVVPSLGSVPVPAAPRAAPQAQAADGVRAPTPEK